MYLTRTPDRHINRVVERRLVIPHLASECEARMDDPTSSDTPFFWSTDAHLYAAILPRKQSVAFLQRLCCENAPAETPLDELQYVPALSRKWTPLHAREGD
jgi:hypothetical protein